MKKLILSCLFLSVSSLTSALNLDVQRDVFSDILNLQVEKKWEEANEKISSITDYPLAYIAEFNYLNANISEVSDEEILSFIRSYKDKALSNNLEKTYLFHLAEQKRWNDFLTTYPTFPNDPTLQCHYLQAATISGKGKEVWGDAEKLWLNSTSLPNACDDVYTFYKDNKMLTQTHIWQRFQFAYEKNEQGLMRFLITKMNKKNASLATKLYRLHKNPKHLLSSYLFPSRGSESFSFLVPSINRLASKDIKKAMEAFKHFEKIMPFTFKETIEMKIKFSNVILQNDKKNYFKWLDKQLSSLGNLSLIEQRIRYAIKRDDWSNIEYWLSELPESNRNKNPWLYWQARVLEHKGKSIEANVIYEKVAMNRSYYGFMAAKKLGISFPFNAELVKEQHGSLRYLNEELVLIEELLFHRLSGQAKKQWRRLLSKHTFDLQQQLGLYAHQRGWSHLSVLASINNSESHDALNIRFPKPSSTVFANEANKYNLEESYIYAITRRESSFDEQAKSPVGASGYMQLMPNTAKETARKIGLKGYKDIAQLNQGKINVPLGVAYYNGLMKRYDGNRVLATAAYNAGPHRVDKWFSPNKARGKKGIDMESWVESIPYRETRAYVQNILVYNVIYQQVLGRPLKFITKQELLGSY